MSVEAIVVEISKLQLKDGDMLVFRVPRGSVQEFTRSAMEVRSNLEMNFPQQARIPYILIPNDVELTRITKSDFERLPE